RETQPQEQQTKEPPADGTDATSRIAPATPISSCRFPYWFPSHTHVSVPLFTTSLRRKLKTLFCHVTTEYRHMTP
ncbi:MAG: hypothetical protein ACK56X_04450, partial [Planctomyces sp.]